MISKRDKVGFYTALFLHQLGIVRRRFVEIDDTPLTDVSRLPQKLRVHFWTPHITPGAEVTVYDIWPAFEQRLKALKLDWTVTASVEPPADRCDWLICFKAVPAESERRRHGKVVMLICDQVELYWSDLPKFDAVVATACRPLASILAGLNRNTIFIGETQPLDYLEAGKAALATPPSKRAPVLTWHGGRYTLGALTALRPVLENFAAAGGVELHVVSGQEPERTERWGNLLVRFLPWSKDQLKASASIARLGILPAREGARVSYIKPASRVRLLYALGAPAVGDSRTPDVIDFAGSIGAPVADSPKEWARVLARLWNDPARLDTLARAGYDEVAAHHSAFNAAERWIRFLGATPLR